MAKPSYLDYATKQRYEKNKRKRQRENYPLLSFLDSDRDWKMWVGLLILFTLAARLLPVPKPVDLVQVEARPLFLW